MKPAVNNAIYDELGERWYTAVDDPVALLRSEAAFRNPWIAAELERELGPGPKRVLDVGCGAGFLSNSLARAGHLVTGVDLSPSSLEVARAHAPGRGAPEYRLGDATGLPVPDGGFDAVCAMDLLEHVDRPERVVAEAARALRPGGLFFFYTFNRGWLSELLVVRFLEWRVKNTPERLHVSHLFVKPEELRAMCDGAGLSVGRLLGVKPVLLSRPALRLALTGRVRDGFPFEFTRSLRLAYLGWAKKDRQ